MSISSRFLKEAEKEKEKKEQSQDTTRRTTESAASVTQRFFNQAEKETGRKYTVKVKAEEPAKKQSAPTTSYLDTARNASKATITTEASKISGEDKERRRNELKAELEEMTRQADLNKKKQVGYMRGNVTNLLREAEAEGAKINSRISELNDELKKLDLPDTISYNERQPSSGRGSVERDVFYFEGMDKYFPSPTQVALAKEGDENYIVTAVEGGIHPIRIYRADAYIWNG